MRSTLCIHNNSTIKYIEYFNLRNIHLGCEEKFCQYQRKLLTLLDIFILILALLAHKSLPESN